MRVYPHSPWYNAGLYWKQNPVSPVGTGEASVPEYVTGVFLAYCPWNDITHWYEQKFRIVASDIVRWYWACATELHKSHLILKQGHKATCSTNVNGYITKEIFTWNQIQKDYRLPGCNATQSGRYLHTSLQTHDLKFSWRQRTMKPSAVSCLNVELVSNITETVSITNIRADVQINLMMETDIVSEVSDINSTLTWLTAWQDLLSLQNIRKYLPDYTTSLLSRQQYSVASVTASNLTTSKTELSIR